MSRLSGLIIALVALGALAIWNTPERRTRERITLYVDTPEGPASGSSVIESEVVFQDGWLGGLAHHSLVSGAFGQATVVDLGTRGALFGLLIPDEGRRSQSYGPGAYADATFSELDEQAKRAWPESTEKHIAMFVDTLNRLKPKGEVRLDNLGLLVRFRDPNDPSTVERVDPNDLAASFGRGVRLTRATVEIVDEPLTTGIEKTLPWLAAPRDSDNIARPHGPIPAETAPLYDQLLYYDFWRPRK